MIDGLKPYSRMKDSGVPWLGVIPEHWETQPLKRVCQRSALYGANIASSAYASKGLRFLRTTDIDDDGRLRPGGVYVHEETMSDYKLTSGDILISRSGTVGRSFLFDEQRHGPCAYAGYLVRFVPSSRLLPRFAFFFTKTQSFSGFLRVSAISSTIENVNGEKYANCPLCVPPAAEQAAIVRFLDYADRRIRRYIRAKQKLIKLLEEQKQSIIHRAVTGQIDVRTGQPYPKYKPSGVPWLGEVPEHWDVVQLRRLIKRGTSITYGIVQAGPDWPNGIPYIRTSNMKGWTLPAEGYLKTSPIIDKAYARSKVEAGDLVVAIRATLGKGLVVPESLAGANLTQGTAKVSPGSRLEPLFLFYSFNSTACQTAILLVAKGTTFLEITLEELRKIQMAIPARAEQAIIVKHLEEACSTTDKTIAKCRDEISLLHEYRTRLIADVVTGKLDVREAAARLPDEPDEMAESLDEPESDGDDTGADDEAAGVAEESEA